MASSLQAVVANTELSSCEISKFISDSNCQDDDLPSGK